MACLTSFQWGPRVSEVVGVRGEPGAWRRTLQRILESHHHRVYESAPEAMWCARTVGPLVMRQLALRA